MIPTSCWSTAPRYQRPRTAAIAWIGIATLATRRPVLTLAAGPAESVVIETAQAIVPSLGRACDTNDWLMNTIGVVTGVLLASATIAIARRVDAGRAGRPDRHTRHTR